MPVQHEGNLKHTGCQGSALKMKVEVLDALKASMRAKVAALSEDNWMYEAEEQPRVH
jgi:hypothetical protein